MTQSGKVWRSFAKDFGVTSVLRFEDFEPPSKPAAKTSIHYDTIAAPGARSQLDVLDGRDAAALRDLEIRTEELRRKTETHALAAALYVHSFFY